MTKVNLYRYVENDGSVTVTPKQRTETDTPYKEKLIADDGKALTGGENVVGVVDVGVWDVGKWTEIDAPIDEYIK